MRRLPYVITAIVPFQVVLAAVGLRYLLYALLVGGTALFVLRAALQGRATRGLAPIVVFLGYVVVLALRNPGLVAAYGVLVYGQFAVFWMAYAYAYGEPDAERLTRVNLMAASVVAMLGIYQFFVDPTLLGFALERQSQIASYLGGSAALRVSSILPSAMMLGAYLVLSGLAALALPQRRSGTTCLAVLCFVCAVFTGNKSTFLCLAAATAYGIISWQLEHGRRMRALLFVAGGTTAYLVLLFTAAAWGPVLEGLSPTAFRAAGPFFLTGDVQQINRLVAYWGGLFLLFGGTGVSLVFGNGPGLTRQDTTFFGGQALGDYPVAEGFLVQVVFELGFVGLVFFHLVLWKAFRQARAERAGRRVGVDHVLLALWASMLVVHVFAGIFTGFLWGYIVGLLGRRQAAGYQPLVVGPAPATVDVAG